MLRAVLGLVLLVVVGGIGFYMGRVKTTASADRYESARPAVLPTSPDETTTRGRSIEPPPTPPAIAVAPPSSGPPIDNERVLPEPPPEGDASQLMNRGLGLPLAGLKKSDLYDTFNQPRAAGERRHEAADIMAPRGTPVVAVDNGIIAKLFTSKQGGLTIYQFDSAEKFCFYYAHLDRYAEGLREGMLVKRGDTIAYVGSTGNANPAAPHLHFSIFELGPEKRWWEGKPINPYPILSRSLK